jgi:hypothetical protein
MAKNWHVCLKINAQKFITLVLKKIADTFGAKWSKSPKLVITK